MEEVDPVSFEKIKRILKFKFQRKILVIVDLFFYDEILIVCYINQTTKLHFRGARIFSAVMEELLARGMVHAKNVITLMIEKRFLYIQI